MSWYKCNECGLVHHFRELTEKKQFHPEAAEDGRVPFEISLACPVCGSDDLYQLETCRICGKPITNWTGDICRDCFNAILKSIESCVEERKGEGIELTDAIQEAHDELFHYLFNN